MSELGSLQGDRPEAVALPPREALDLPMDGRNQLGGGEAQFRRSATVRQRLAAGITVALGGALAHARDFTAEPMAGSGRIADSLEE